MTLDDAAADLARQMADSKERHISRLIGLRFRHTAGVSIRKPRYMPTWLYERLMRTIVVVDGPTVFTVD